MPRKPENPIHQQRRQLTDQRRGTAHSRGYGVVWARASAAFLHEFPLCGMRPGRRPPILSRCWDLGLTTPATQTDHVVPHHGDGSLFWDRERNWQALCASCGARKSQAGQ